MRNFYSGKTVFKYLIAVFTTVLSVSGVFAQINHNATTTPVTSTIPVGNTKYYDNGGPGGGNTNGLAGNYSNGLAGTVHTIRPRGGVGVFARVNFLSFNVENNFDQLEIFNEATPIAPIGAARTGTAIPAGNPFTATNANGALTFRFTSDNTGDRAGWDATASLVDNTGAAVSCTPFINFKAGTIREAGFDASSRAYYCSKTLEFGVSSDVNTQNSYEERFDSVVVNFGDGNSRLYTQGASLLASKATQRLAPTGFRFEDTYSYALPGVYRVTVLLYNELGCSETRTFNVVVTDVPTFGGTTVSPFSICEGQNFTLNRTASLVVPDRGTGTGSYTAAIGTKEWLGPDPSNLASTIVLATNQDNLPVSANTYPPGTYTFTYRVVLANNCTTPYTNDVSVSITTKPNAGKPNLTILPGQICETVTSVNLFDYLNMPYDNTGTWKSKNGQLPAAQISGSTINPNAIATGFGYGSYRFVYTVSSPGCTSDSAEFQLFINKKANPGDGVDTLVPICETNANTKLLDFFKENGATPDNGGYWRINGVQVYNDTIFINRLDATKLTPNPTPQSPYTITYVVSNPSCGESSQSISVRILATPFVASDTTIFVCQGEPIINLYDLIQPSNSANGDFIETSVSPTSQSFDGAFFDPNNETVSGTFTFEYTATENVPPCFTDKISITIVYQNRPDAGSDDNGVACSNQVFDLTTAQIAPGNTSVKWFGPNDNVTPVVDPTAVDLSSIVGAGPDSTVTFTAIDFSNSPACVSDTAIFTLKVSKFSATGSKPSDTLFVCVTDAKFKPFDRLLGTKDMGGKSTLVAAAPLTGTGATAEFTPSVAIANQTFTYTYSFDANGACPAIMTSYKIAVTPKPNAGADRTAITLLNQACSSDLTFDLKTLVSADNGVNGPATNPFIKYSFKLSNNTVPAFLDPATGIVTVTGLNGTFNFNYIVENTTIGCQPDTAKLVLRVNRVPNAGSDNFIITCNDGPSVTLFPLVAPADGDVPAEMRDGTFTGTGVANGNNPVAALFNPTGLPSASDSITYIVTVPKCPSDTAKIYTFVSKKPVAGTAIVPSMGVCETEEAFDLYTLLNGTFDRGGTWTLSLGGNWDPAINADVNGPGRLTTYFNPTPTDTNIFDVKAFIAFVNSTTTPTFTDANPPVFRFKYSICDTNKFVYNGMNLTPPAACPCAETFVDLEVSQFFTAVQRTQTVFDVCQANNAVNLNTLILSSYNYRKNQLPPAPITDKFMWTVSPDNTPSLMQNDSIFSGGATNPAITYNVTLVRESEGCNYDPIVATIRIIKTPNAGSDGQVTVCEDVTTPLDLRTVVIGADQTGTSVLDAATSDTPGAGSYSNGSNTFLIDKAGPGTYKFIYTVNATPGCGSTSTSRATVIVTKRPFAGTSREITICVGEPTIFLGPLLGPAGGVDPSGAFTINSGAGLAGSTYTDGSFTTPGAGTLNSVNYTVKKVGCQNVVSTLTFRVLDTVSAGMQNVNDTAFCSTGGAINLLTLLGNATPGGVFTPTTPGLSGVTFTPLPANVGRNILSYTVKTNAEICSNPERTSSVILNIERAPVAGTDGTIDICKNSDLLNLFNVIKGLPDNTGVFTASPGIVLGGANSEIVNINQAIIVEGNSYNFDYTVTGDACPDDVSRATVRVLKTFKTGNPKPAYDTVCASVPTYDLFKNVGQNNVDYNRGGVWRDKNGNGVASLINPGTYPAGVNFFTYSAPVTGSPCAEIVDTVYLTISPVPVAGKDGMVNVCEDATTINLFNVITGFQAGGTWSAFTGTPSTGLSGSTFNLGALPAAARVGTFTYIYIVKSNGCANDTAFATIKVNKKSYAGAAVQNVTICNNGSQIDLLTLLKQEAGVTTSLDLTGTFTSNDAKVVNNNALNGSFFNSAAVGSSVTPYRFTYTTSAVGCSSGVVTLNVTVLEGGRDTAITVCKTVGQINLFDLAKAGNTTGKWKVVSPGTGNVPLVGERVFDPSRAVPGTTYVYQLKETNFDPLAVCEPTVTITVVDTLKTTNLSFDVTGNTYRVRFNIVGGLAPYTVLDEVNMNSQSVASSSVLYTSDMISLNNGYKFTISDKASCKSLIISGADLGDNDKDGILNIVDLDDDNDGASDIIESLGFDASGDDDQDGVPNFKDPDFCASVGGTLNAGSVCSVFDFDGDGIINQFDLDSDNDGIPDLTEVFPLAASTLDADFNGIVDNVGDVDNNGWRDVAQSAFGNGSLVPNTDGMNDLFGKKSYDFLDIDSDDDGIADAIEAGADPKRPVNTDKLPGFTNGDDLQDYRDLDSDGDGILDKFEAGPDLFTATNTDGVDGFDYVDLDSDNDGIPDAVEARLSAPGTAPADFDSDGLADFRDLDSDNDNIGDLFEAGANPTTPRNTRGAPFLPNYINLDSDGDGIPDIIEGGVIRPIIDAPVNTDAPIDNLEDYIDLDSDNDGILDSIEAGVVPSLPLDTDNDGIYDFRSLDSDADGILDTLEYTKARDLVSRDSDGDGIMDFQDIDSDGDGIADKVEAFDIASGMPNVLSDKNKDGILDYLDLDSDGDSIPDRLERSLNPSADTGVLFTVIDTDADGTPDFRDLDSDNDGVSDKVEGTADCDNDGIRNFQDAGDKCKFLVDVPQGFSPNNDGVNDNFIIPKIEDYPNNKVTIFNRWGAMVFELSNYSKFNAWNGLDQKSKELLPAGTYFYLVDLGLNQEAIKGYVQINR